MASLSARWHDPHSPVLSKIDFGVPLVELFKWLDVRDILLGDNYKDQDITKALALARDCKHPDAEWLTSIFEGKDVSTKDEARQVFLSLENDARALCFAWLLTEEEERDEYVSLLHRAAATEHAFACSTLFVWSVQVESKEKCFRLARLAAAQRERDGYSLLGRCFRHGFGCEEDEKLAKDNFLIAAELGDAFAANAYLDLLDEDDLARWVFLGRGALLGRPFSFFFAFLDPIRDFFFGSGNASVVFLIGRALQGNIDKETRKIFSSHDKFDSLVGPANQAVSFYESQIKCARLAVDTWALVASRLHLIKDIRVLVGKMVWEARFEANYKI